VYVRVEDAGLHVSFTLMGNAWLGAIRKSGYYSLTDPRHFFKRKFRRRHSCILNSAQNPQTSIFIPFFHPIHSSFLSVSFSVPKSNPNFDKTQKNLLTSKNRLLITSSEIFRFLKKNQYQPSKVDLRYFLSKNSLTRFY